ncbi:helix-turn-helix domain-containing protein [Nocardioides speluncae]|uniref:helix-turn-helix domain-containing protein n=1 Tax=Nocardioides speluncae TaxID=2670337 RepID=UPI00198021D0|nr:helix-turn-helix domain-containing protein [Nocardioides speluncae]
MTTREILATESEDLLTTGEAARILGTSRQHVVDMCKSGLLPYTLAGTHRRIRRRDLEEFRSGSVRPSRDQRRSMWLNMAVAGTLVRHPEPTLALARENLAALRAQHPRGQAARWLAEWDRLLGGPIERVLEVLTSTTQYARELRQNSPFAGALTPQEREEVLAAFTDYTRARNARVHPSGVAG